MSALKSLGFAVLRGAAFGLGFLLIVLVVLMSLGSFTLPGHSVDTNSSHTGLPQRPTTDQLVITNAKEVANSSETSTNSKCNDFSMIYQKQFTGTVENKGPDSGPFLNVYADLFDKDGAFIYQCQTQFQEPLKHGEKQNFIIECHGLPSNLSEKYATFKIYARGG